jgi:hypothetical protein
LPTLTIHSSPPPTPSTLTHTASTCARTTSHLTALYHVDADAPADPYRADTPPNDTSDPYHLDTDPSGPRFHPTIDTFCDPVVFISVPPPKLADMLTLTIDGLAYRVPGDDQSLHWSPTNTLHCTPDPTPSALRQLTSLLFTLTQHTPLLNTMPTSFRYLAVTLFQLAKGPTFVPLTRTTSDPFVDITVTPGKPVIDGGVYDVGPAVDTTLH